MSSAKWRPFCLGLNVLKANIKGSTYIQSMQFGRHGIKLHFLFLSVSALERIMKHEDIDQRFALTYFGCHF